MTIVVFGLAAIGVLVCLNDWRRGLLLCIVAGFLQDPLRKVTPGRPVVLVVLVAILFCACLAGAFLRGQRLGNSELLRWFPTLRAPLAAFAIVVVLQSGATLLRFHNLTLAGLGLLGYLSPIAALILLFQHNRTWNDALRWIRLYLAGALVVAASVMLQFLGRSPAIFDSIGLDIVYGVGGTIAMLCGIMRSSEIAAFHAAVGACLALTLVAAYRSPRIRMIYASMIPFFLLTIVLSGRRKMLAQFALFLVTFLFFLVRSRQASSRVASLAATLVLVMVLIAVPLLVTEPGQGTLSPYLQRSTSLFSEAFERLSAMTVGSAQVVLSTTGLFGAGAGTTAQGSQYFGGSEAIVGSAAEGGLARVLAELGLPGLLCLIWVSTEIFRALRSTIHSARQLPPAQAVLVLGLTSFVPSHAAVFATAHQVYGDPFVLLVLGSLIGFAMSGLRIHVTAAARAAEAGRAGSPVQPGSAPAAPGPAALRPRRALAISRAP